MAQSVVTGLLHAAHVGKGTPTTVKDYGLTNLEDFLE